MTQQWGDFAARFLRSTNERERAIAQEQHDLWEQKGLLAKVHALEVEHADHDWDRFWAIKRLMREESWPALKNSFENFIDHPYPSKAVAAMGIEDALQAEEQTQVLEAVARDWRRIITLYGSDEWHQYALNTSATTARFLRAVARYVMEHRQDGEASGGTGKAKGGY